MDFFQFITAWWTTNVELVRALAWPIVVMASVWILRKPLTELLPRVERIRAGDNEVIFQKQVEQLKKEADNLDIPKLPAIQTTVTIEQQRKIFEGRAEANKVPELPEFDPAAFLLEVNKLADSPAYALSVAMSGLHFDLEILLAHRPGYDPNFVEIPVRFWAKILMKEGYLSSKTEDLIQGLYKASGFLEETQHVRREDVLDFNNLVARARLAIRADYANVRASSKNVTADNTNIRADNESNMPSDLKED